MSGGRLALNDHEKRVLALLASDFVSLDSMPAPPPAWARTNPRSSEFSAMADARKAAAPDAQLHEAFVQAVAGKGTGHEMGDTKWDKKAVFELLKTAAYGSEKEPRELAIGIINTVARGYHHPEEGGLKNEAVAKTTVAQHFFDQGRENFLGQVRGVSSKRGVLQDLVALNAQIDRSGAFERRDSDASSTGLRSDSPIGPYHGRLVASAPPVVDVKEGLEGGGASYDGRPVPSAPPVVAPAPAPAPSAPPAAASVTITAEAPAEAVPAPAAALVQSSYPSPYPIQLTPLSPPPGYGQTLQTVAPSAVPAPFPPPIQARTAQVFGSQLGAGSMDDLINRFPSAPTHLPTPRTSMQARPDGPDAGPVPSG